MKIFIVTNYFDEPVANKNSRYKEIARILAEHNHQVEIITSSFEHMKKKDKGINDLFYDGYEIKHFYEKGYPKNICIQRFFSHAQFARNVIRYLKSVEKPDIIYLGVPPLKLGTACAKFCKKNNVKLIVDVQDLWPEAFKMVFNPPIVGNMVYMPFVLQANKVYGNADAIIAVSETYRDRALKVNKKVNSGLSVFLGTDLAKFDEYSLLSTYDKSDCFTVGYIGTLGASYAITDVIKAIKHLKGKGVSIKFLVMGDGPQRGQYEGLARECGINAEFTGNLPYSEMVKRLVRVDIAVNPIVKGSAGSIINKVGDYAAAGLAVVNTQECKEYREKVEKLEIGINCDNGDIAGIAEAIKTLYDDKELRLKMGNNNRKWAESAFDRAQTYKEIINVIETIIPENKE